jgi:hypothetical protein
MHSCWKWCSPSTTHNGRTSSVIQRCTRTWNCLSSNPLILSLSNIKNTTIVMKILFITYRDRIHTILVPCAYHVQVSPHYVCHTLRWLHKFHQHLLMKKRNNVKASFHVTFMVIYFASEKARQISSEITLGWIHVLTSQIFSDVHWMSWHKYPHFVTWKWGLVCLGFIYTMSSLLQYHK